MMPITNSGALAFWDAWANKGKELSVFVSEMERVDDWKLEYLERHGFQYREDKKCFFGEFEIAPETRILMKMKVTETSPRKSIRVKCLSHLESEKTVKAIMNSIIYCLN
jgi:hypothetical protein